MPHPRGEKTAFKVPNEKGGNYEENQQMSIHCVDGMHAFQYAAGTVCERC